MEHIEGSILLRHFLMQMFFTSPQNLMEIQTYVNVLQQIIQTTPRVSPITTGICEVSIAVSKYMLL